MIIVTVSLQSSRTRETRELARMHICNDDTGTDALRNYNVRTLRGRSTRALNHGQVQRVGAVLNWPSHQLHVWNLVGAALGAMGYGKKR